MTVVPINCGNKTEIHRVKWIVKNPETIIENGYMVLENGMITDVGVWDKNISGNVIDHGDGVIIPSLVNAHTHLELSAFKGLVPYGSGFKTWVGALLELRERADKETLKKGFYTAIDELQASGCFVTGEIASLCCFEDEFYKSDIEGVYFREYLGGMQATDYYHCTTAGTKVQALAGHAPHTTSPELLRHLKKKCSEYGLPFSIHLSESVEEDIFIKTGKGEWADYLTLRGIDYSSWPVTHEGSVSYIHSLGLFDEKTIVVHLLNADNNDFELLKDNKVSVCLCLRSNQNLHGRLPDVLRMYNDGIRLCLGTDSLASTESLSILDEMAYLHNHFPDILPQDIFKMATMNGARALGVSDRFGTIETGKTGKTVFLSSDYLQNSDLFTSLLRDL